MKKNSALFDANIRYFFSKRLLEALQTMLKNPLTVVEAPAGYGKSVAVREFLSKAHVTTIIATASQTSPERFWPNFCRALARDVPNAGDLSKALLRLGLPRDYAQSRAALELMRQITFPQQSFLVFDDCHNAPRSFLDFCESLAASNDALSGVHVVYITRHALSGNREALRPQGPRPCIDRHVFTLTSPEIRDFYALYDICLRPGEEQELHAITEGWIYSLQLSLAWYKKHGNFSSFQKDIAAGMREMMYTPLSAEAKDLLLTLTPLECVTAEQASTLYGSDARALLEELTSKNAFVFLDHASKVYSPHALLWQFLQGLFKEKGVLTDERRREIYRACGDVLKKAGEFASAVAAWHNAGDFESALAALEENLSGNPVTERAEVYFAMFRDCPEEILERHLGASFKYAIAAFSAGDLPAFEARLAWLAKRCAALPDGDDTQRWRGELHVLLALMKFNDTEAMSRHHRMAFDLLKKPTSLYGPDSPWTLGSPSVLFMFYRESGKLADALRLMHECMPYYYQLASCHGAGAEFLMEAEALYYAGDFAKAEKTCQIALAWAVRREQLANEFCAMFLQMRLALLAGDVNALFGGHHRALPGANPGGYGGRQPPGGIPEERVGLMAGMRGMIAKGKNYFLLHTADLCEGWLYAALGLHDNIPLWLRSELSDESRLYAFARGYYYIVHGRALLLAGEYARVITQFNGLLHAEAFSQHLLFSVYAHIYLATALQKTGRRQMAVDTLKTALHTALPDALHMPFAENYDLVGPLLTKALSGKGHKRALSHIEILAKQVDAGREAVLRSLPEGANKQAAEKLQHEVIDWEKMHTFAARFDLTIKQIGVLSCILRNLSVKEMSRSMGISRKGIEFHITNILEKTGVVQRRDLPQLYAAWKSNP